MAFPSCVLNSTYLSSAPNLPLGFFPVCLSGLSYNPAGPTCQRPSYPCASSFFHGVCPSPPSLPRQLPEDPPSQPITPSPTPLTTPHDPEQVSAKAGPAFMHVHASSHLQGGLQFSLISVSPVPDKCWLHKSLLVNAFLDCCS